MLNENGVGDSDDDAPLKEELTQILASLENDTKTFEDLEFQYLEEETEWLAYREELHNEQKLLRLRIEEKRSHIHALEVQGIDNQRTACADTKHIEKNLFALLNDMERCREELKTIDTLLYELSDQKPDESDDDLSSMENGNCNKNDMSQSLFGSKEILTDTKQQQHHDDGAMTKSLNENMFSCKIETLPFVIKKPSNGERIETEPVDADVSESDSPKSTTAIDMQPVNDEKDAQTDPLQKLKYNLTPPFEHKIEPDSQKTVNLNLSIEGDDFEVNPMDKRVPSQDDIDRICKVQLDAPISTQGASFKVVESIKEIERNRQLLLAQQGEYPAFRNILIQVPRANITFSFLFISISLCCANRFPCD